MEIAEGDIVSYRDRVWHEEELTWLEAEDHHQARAVAGRRLIAHACAAAQALQAGPSLLPESVPAATSSSRSEIRQ